MKRKRKRHPVIDRTYRTAPMRTWWLASHLIGQRVVVYMPNARRWKRGYLTGLLPGYDLFFIKWKKRSEGRKLSGIWRVHPASLFTSGNLLPIPLEPARVPPSTNHRPKEGKMATKPRPKKKAAKPKAKAAPAKAAADENGGGRTRTDKLAGLSEARRRNIAKLIFRERSKSPATSWPDIQEKIQEKYDWELPGSMTGRRLLRDYGPDDAEAAIIKQNRKPKEEVEEEAPKKRAPKKAGKKKRAAVVEEPEEEEDEEEELEDEEEDEEEEELEYDEDEDEEEYEDEEEDEEEEEPEPPKAKKVSVKRGRGKKANPS